MEPARDFGQYELVDLLGRGGMGEVWRARHRLLGRAAAIKLVRPDAVGVTGAASARTVLKRFEREASGRARAAFLRRDDQRIGPTGKRRPIPRFGG